MPQLPVRGRLRLLLSCTLWPLLYGGGLAGAGMAFASDHPLLWFNAAYLALALAIGVFERLMPHEEAWLKPDRETVDDLAHTALTKGLAVLGATAMAGIAMTAATVAEPAFHGPGSPWPEQWPLPAQVVLGLVVAELGLYAAHRVAHRYLGFWRFHALHHSVGRLWVVNTGRFHLMDSLWKIALSQTPLLLLGAPLPVFLWISAVTAVTGLLTHCNIELRTGPLDLVFSTPALHRWHHSRRRDEGNRNFGENLVLWDQILGTYFNPPRRPPAKIGIDGRIARGFLRQLAQPFTRKGVRAILGKAPAAAETSGRGPSRV
jgi:sterol desaturase/sphingolipid hydroxylase (fatty acid hydroxylase superfamily)